MKANVSAPILSRVKSWQLIGLGISGWCALYSAAFLTWSSNRDIIGNTQGGCFAAAMTLASLQVRRYKPGSFTPDVPCHWASGISTPQLNQFLKQIMEKQECRVEACHPVESELGFGLRAISSGRTVIFETGRWQEPVIDLLHAQTTEENRKRTTADQAVIVGIGTPDDETRVFVRNRPVRLLAGKELEKLIVAEKLEVEKPAAESGANRTEPGARRDSASVQSQRHAAKRGKARILSRLADTLHGWRNKT